GLVIQDFVDPARIESSREQLKQNRGQLILIVGAGTSLIEPDPDVLIYADLPRWEIQQRQRRNEIGNLAVENLYESPSLKYKRGYFLDWRLADRKSTRLNSSHVAISYAVFCLKKKNN